LKWHVHCFLGRIWMGVYRKPSNGFRLRAAPEAPCKRGPVPPVEIDIAPGQPRLSWGDLRFFFPATPLLLREPSLCEGGLAMRCLIKLLREQEAATAVEYAVLIAMILLTAIGTIGMLGSQSGGMWGNIETDLRDVGFFGP